MAEHTIGDGPVEARYQAQMKKVARWVDRRFNEPYSGNKRKVGFVLLVFPFDDHGGRCNYMSNANREDVIVLLREQLARFQGMPDVPIGRA